MKGMGVIKVGAGLAMAVIGGCLGDRWIPDERPEPVQLLPPVVLILEGNTARISVTPPQRLDVLMTGDPDDDPEYFEIRCAQWGNTTLHYYPATSQYICENVDY
jgi:hypothetical protein